MIDYTVEQLNLSIPVLDGQLRATLGSSYGGISYNGRSLRVHFLVEPGVIEKQRVNEALVAHNPVVIEASRSDNVVKAVFTKPFDPAVLQVQVLVNGEPLPELIDTGTEVVFNSASQLVLSAADAQTEVVKL